MKHLLLVTICTLLTVCSTIPAQAAELVVRYTIAPSNTPQKSIDVSVSDNYIKVANAPVGSRLEIYSVVGLRVKEIEMKEAFGEYFVNISKGYYIVRIADTVRKIVIR